MLVWDNISLQYCHGYHQSTLLKKFLSWFHYIRAKHYGKIKGKCFCLQLLLILMWLPEIALIIMTPEATCDSSSRSIIYHWAWFGTVHIKSVFQHTTPPTIVHWYAVAEPHYKLVVFKINIDSLAPGEIVLKYKECSHSTHGSNGKVQYMFNFLYPLLKTTNHEF